MKELPLTSSDLQTSSTAHQNSFSTFLWSAAGFAVFTVSWKWTNGGYACCIPLLVLLLLYSYWSQLLNIHIFKTVFSEVKSNVSHLLRHEKRNTAFIVIYWLVKVALSTWYPWDWEIKWYTLLFGVFHRFLQPFTLLQLWHALLSMCAYHGLENVPAVTPYLGWEWTKRFSNPSLGVLEDGTGVLFWSCV